jgi:hypothetical protein
VELSEKEVALIHALPKQEVRLPYEALRRQARVLAASLLQRAPTTGPKPVAWTGEVEHDPNAESWTYLMRFGERNVWKVGYTQDIDRRLAELNLHVPQEALGEQWNLVRQCRTQNSFEAYEMEQRLLSALSPYRSIGERVVCVEEIVQAVWNSDFGSRDAN